MVETVETEAERILAFKQTLKDLVCNSKPHIIMLTELAAAEAHIESAATGIARVIEDRIREVRGAKYDRKAGEKPVRPEEIEITLLYLIDSIVKNAKDPAQRYLHLFTQNIVSNFCDFFKKSDEKIRDRLFKLRSTWTGLFPADKLSALDVRIKQIDPAWPFRPGHPVPTPSSGNSKSITTTTSAGQQVHVNRRFLLEDQSRGSPAGSAAERLRQETLKKIEEDKEKIRQQEKRELELENRRLQMQVKALSQSQSQDLIREEELHHQLVQQQQQHSIRGGKRKQQQVNPIGKRHKNRGRAAAGAQLNGHGNGPLNGHEVAQLRSPPQMSGAPVPVPQLYSRRPPATAQQIDQQLFGMNGMQYEDHFNAPFRPQQQQPLYPEANEYAMYGHQMHQGMGPMQALSSAFTAGPVVPGPVGPGMQAPPLQQHLMAQSSPSQPSAVSTLLSNLSVTTAQSSTIVPSSSSSASENPLQNVLELLGMTSGTINNRQSEPQTVPGPGSGATVATACLQPPAAVSASGDKHLLLSPWAQDSSRLLPAAPTNPSIRNSSSSFPSAIRTSPPSHQHHQISGNNRNTSHLPKEAPLEWTSESMKIPRPSLVAALYDGRQCTNCPQRFSHQMEDGYNKHLDWHYRQNKKKRSKPNRSAGQCRPWYYRLDLWLLFKEVNDDDDKEEIAFDEDQKEEQEDAEERTVRARSNAAENVCKVCQEKFESVFRDDDEEWILLNAVEHESDIYHPACLNDFIRNGNTSILEASAISLSEDCIDPAAEPETSETLSTDHENDQKDVEKDEKSEEGIVVEAVSEVMQSEAEAEQSEAQEKVKEDAEVLERSEIPTDKQASVEVEGKTEEESKNQEEEQEDQSQEEEEASDPKVEEEEKKTDIHPHVHRERGNVVMKGREESAACLIM